MLMLNEEILFIRVNKYEYLLKKGTISNYSFNIIDEDRLGFLTLLFEELDYPMEEQDIQSVLQQELTISEEQISDILTQLRDSDILVAKSNKKKETICVLTPSKTREQVTKKLKEAVDNEIRVVDLETVDYFKINEDILALFMPYYSPVVLHEIDEFCVRNNKKLFVTYVDGDEGIILPLMANDGLCYNDYEIMRESSLHNLLDYQVMKEHLISKKVDMKIHAFKWEYVLISSLLILKRHLEKTLINSFAYSIDIERFIIIKTKLFRFPKNSLSQSDINIKHPFI